MKEQLVYESMHMKYLVIEFIKTESKTVVCKGCGVGREDKLLFNNFCRRKKIVEIAVVMTAQQWIYLMPPKRTLKNLNGKFHIMYIYHDEK